MPDQDQLPTNKDRAARAAQAIEQFTDDRATDLLADLMHFCDANQLDFEEQLDVARRTYTGDIEEEKHRDLETFLENAVVIDASKENIGPAIFKALKERTPKGHA
jgi:hypothetical protein